MVWQKNLGKLSSKKGFQLEEAQLVQLLIQKDESAFKQVVEFYHSKVYNTVIGFLRSDEQADDLAQEVFITVFESIDKFRGDSLLGTWIYRIAVTKSLEHLRKQKRKKRWGMFYSLFNEDLSPRFESSNYYHPGVALEDRERSELLFKAVDKLPELQRAAFTLQKIEGMSYEETAKVLNTSTAAVESLLQRANMNLRKYLTSYYKQ